MYTYSSFWLYDSLLLNVVLCSKYEVSTTPQGDIKVTEQKLPRLPSDYAEPVDVSSPDTDEDDPIYEDVEVTTQQSADVTATDVKMEDNPAYGTSVF